MQFRVNDIPPKNDHWIGACVTLRIKENLLNIMMKTM